MNALMKFKQDRDMTYNEIAGAIAQRTGRQYSPIYIGNICRGSTPLTDGMKFNLVMTFDDFGDYLCLETSNVIEN